MTMTTKMFVVSTPTAVVLAIGTSMLGPTPFVIAMWSAWLLVTGWGFMKARRAS